MSTRGIIARVNEQHGWAGNYHHWDSYPTGLGKSLWELYHGYFQQDLRQMLQVLLDDHPAGWSTINGANFDLEPGWYDDEDFPKRPTCYCHGERHEKARLIFPTDDYGAEWVYVFDEANETITVLMAVDSEGEYAMGFFGSNPRRVNWRNLATFALNEPEPDWKALETLGWGE